MIARLPYDTGSWSAHFPRDFSRELWAIIMTNFADRTIRTGDNLDIVHTVNSALFDVIESGRRVELMLVMPSIDDFAHTPRKARRPASAQQSAW